MSFRRGAKRQGRICCPLLPAGESFRYFHQHAHRGVRKPPDSRFHPVAIIEDEESIQASLTEVINALMRHPIDLKRAELVLRALHIAVKKSRGVKFEAGGSRIVKEVPDYAQPRVASAPEDAEASREPELDIP